MEKYLGNVGNNRFSGFSNNSITEGVDEFINKLQKDFFSNVAIYFSPLEQSEDKLVLVLTCPVTLSDLIFNFNNDIWGEFNGQESSLSVALDELNQKNGTSFEIEELSIVLEDTTIIISEIYENSVQTQLEGILKELSNNHIQITKGLSETPYEIYAPIFEENSNASHACFNEPGAYFRFWGLYFEGDEDPLVYDLDNFKIIPGDLSLINP